MKRGDDVLWYSTDTLGGSSGSPVFNNDWYVVALHHSDVPLMKNGKMQTIDGRDFDDATMGEQDIKWVANEGIRASRIVQTLKASPVKNHPWLRAMFAATPASARVGAGLGAGVVVGAGKTVEAHTPAAAGLGGMTMNNEQGAMASLRATIHVDRDELARAMGGGGG